MRGEIPTILASQKENLKEGCMNIFIITIIFITIKMDEPSVIYSCQAGHSGHDLIALGLEI